MLHETNFMGGDGMLYKYEPHCHTSEGSKCSRIDGASLARFYKYLGYTGIIITDHFYNGNTAVPRELPWNEWVAKFTEGYKNAKKEGDRIGIDVFFAWEYSIKGNDFLIYGLDENWLYEHPDQLGWHYREYMKNVRADGGMVIHAHPFREAGYIDHIRLIPRDCDGVEVLNASMQDPEVNRRALWYADSYKLIKCAGSDNHVGKREHLGGVYLPERIKSVGEFITLMKSGKGEIFADRYDADNEFMRV